jgi:ribonuclease BN (tRNA processing enzyme)
VVVYSTDSEHKQEEPGEAERFVQFFRDADLVIFDAMYSLADASSAKEDWGHSSNVIGVELCQRARVRHLCMFHHEPTCDDETLATVLEETRRLEALTRAGHHLEISSAWDGMEIVV